MNKPRFYYQDLNNYTTEFLIEIINWQKEEIEIFIRDMKEAKQ